jgi:ABC-type multidrug transport system ATPase subunit
MIGSTQQKIISGGERKRCSIGVELITDPSVILLDEPTSGLDSFKALALIKLLNRLARKEGKTIISTIHQPSSQAFALFDRLILMQDGNIVY